MSGLDVRRDHMTRSSPTVSICIPTYNSAEFIIDTLDSIEHQTYPNIEIVVVDDRSSDDTWEILNGYQTSRTLRLYRNDTNLGMAANWDRAVRMCSGKYVKLLCADDTLDPSLTEMEVQILEDHPEVLCVSSDTRFIDPEGNKKGYYRRYRRNGIIDGRRAVKYSLFTRDYLGAPLANMFRRDMYDTIGGFDPSFAYIPDYLFYAELYNSGKIYILHEALNYFRIRTDSNTGQVLGGDKGERYIQEHRRMLEKLAPVMGLTSFHIWLSVAIRRLTIVMGNIYLKLSLLSCPKGK